MLHNIFDLAGYNFNKTKYFVKLYKLQRAKIVILSYSDAFDKNVKQTVCLVFCSDSDINS